MKREVDKRNNNKMEQEGRWVGNSWKKQGQTVHKRSTNKNENNRQIEKQPNRHTKTER